MKKLFALLMAITMVTVVFGQNKYTVTGVPAGPEQDRSNWIGWYFQSGYVHVQAAESEYQIFIPAGTFTETSTLEKVRFYYIPSENISSYTGDPFTLDNDFVIRIYTGSSISGTDFNPGTLAATQNYNPSEAGAEAGVQLVTLTTPFTVNPTDNVTIGIYCANRSCMGLGDHDPNCANVNFAYWPEYAEGFHHYYYTAGNPAWAYQNATVAEHDPWNLSVYYRDSIPYVPHCDWYAEIYDPDATEDNPDAITELVIDEFVDSLYFYGGAFNKGIDSAVGMFTRAIYLESEDLETPLYFINDTLRELDTVQVNYGWRFGPFAILGFARSEEDPDTPSEWEMIKEEYGIDFPINLCINITYTSTPEYNASDTNLSNNTYCIVLREPEPIGISESENGSLSIQPNPATEAITLDNAAGAQVSIFDMLGREVISIEAASANETINVSKLSEGLYIVKAVNGNKVSSSKVSIVR